MKRLRKLYLQNPVFKFMISYTLILILPLLICLMGYNISFDIVEEEIKENNLAMMNHSKSLIDHQVKTLNTLVMQIATDQTVISLAETENTDDKVFFTDAAKAIERTSELFRHSGSNVIEDIYIYLDNTDYVITTNTLYNAEFYYENILKDRSRSYEEWKEQLLSQVSYNNYLVNNNNIDYVQSLPFKYNAPVSGAVVCRLKEGEIAKFFTHIDVTNGSYVYIQDQNNNIVWNMSENDQALYDIELPNVKNGQGVFKTKVNHEKMIGVYTVSEVNNWKYVMMIPENIVMHKLTNLQLAVFLLLMITLIVGIGISYYLSIKNGQPLKDIIAQIKGSEIQHDISDEELNNIDNLGGAITRIVSKTQNLREELDKQQPLLQTAFFQKVIRGEFTAEQEMKLFADRANITLKSVPQRVVACRVFANNDFYTMDTQTLEEVNVAIILIKNTLRELLGERVYFYDVDYLTTVAIVEQSIEDIYALEQKIKEANAYIIANYYITPAWGISNMCNSWLDMWRSYEEAKKALKSGIKEGYKNIIFYNEVIEDEVSYYYPLDFEQRLIDYCKRADKESMQNLLNILYTENFEKRKLSGETIEKLYEEIQSTIVKITQPNTDYDSLQELQELAVSKDTNTVMKYFEMLMSIYSDISDSVKLAKNQSQAQLVNRIKEYIQQVYIDSNLGLGMVASQFNISEGYISSLFKEQTGINFTEYVEDLRINRACDLLKDTSLNINDIGEQVGYNSVQSFRRAFKRIHGISPSELRKRG